MAIKNKLIGTKTVPVGPADTYKPSRDDEARERRYRAKEAMETLSRADEIRRDGALMREVKSLAKNTMKAVCAPRKK